ncbi:YggS family pyridoxal phosphate-dependent enzyme [Candidatus Pelagibacter sp.]|nr:YggS family pyridoxal phosphate-dependent enzyme [Candidatus Pelagibacter sp.]
MHQTVNNLIKIQNQLKDYNENKLKNFTKIVAVSKTFPIDKILPLIEHGHTDFGENKVQEAIEKWTDIKKKYHLIKLHMIGKLQTNKVKFAINLFDYIHSLDNFKLAKKISDEQKKNNKKPKIFIQINIGNESQKSGINSNEINEFYNYCINDLNLDIIGIMCLPPNDNKGDYYFKKMSELIQSISVNELSMGMSNDYLEAFKSGATFLRIGSNIFGNRN